MRLNRRDVLRGLGATVALPVLEAMLNTSGEAFGDGTSLPVRFGTWFWANGVRLSKWVPTTTGTGWALPAHLAAMEPVKSKISIVSGLANFSPGFDHWGGRSGMLSGTSPATDYGTGSLPSIDQLVAKAWANRTPLRSLQLGISQQGDGFRPAECVSWSGPGQNLPAEFRPRAAFDRLFGLQSTDPKAQRRNRARHAVLDLVADDTRRLKARLGVADRQRLDLHLDSIADLDRKILAAPTTCLTLDRPSEMPLNGSHEQLEPVNRAMSELLAIALSCDLTRVFSMAYSSVLGETLFWPVGATLGWHELTHDSGAVAQAKVDDVIDFTMRQLAFLLVKLDSIPEGPGTTLLDRCIVYGTSCVAEGLSHDRSDMPILIAGTGAGAIKSGVHYRSTSAERVGKVPMTLLRALALPDAAFGADLGLVARSQAIAQLLPA